MLCTFQNRNLAMERKLHTIQNKILATAKIASTYKGVSIKYLNPVLIVAF
jgi:hypothetical protein